MTLEEHVLRKRLVFEDSPEDKDFMVINRGSYPAMLESMTRDKEAELAEKGAGIIAIDYEIVKTEITRVAKERVELR